MAAFTEPLPSLGDDAGEEAQVSFVYVKVGDTVKEGDDLVEMVTDKATFNVPFTKSGKVLKLRVAEGDSVKVGSPLCDLEI